MFLGKLFGRSSSSQKHKLPKSMQGSSLTPPDRKDIKAPQFELVDGVEKTEAPTEDTGFDPYNSGVFDKSNTWKRIPRR